MIKDIKSKPTEYNGVNFRSTLEARYAMAFDRAGVKWRYEPKRFIFNDGTVYTPDFYLFNEHTYFEVKGLFTPEARNKAEQLVKLGKTIVVGIGDDDMLIYSEYCTTPEHVKMCKCSRCGGIQFRSQKRKSDECPSCHEFTMYEVEIPVNLFGENKRQETIPELVESRADR